VWEDTLGRGLRCIVVTGALRSQEAHALEELIVEVLGQQPPALVLDLSEVSSVDGTLLNAIDRVRPWLDAFGGPLVVISPLPEIRAVFQLTEGARRFSTVPDLPAAVEIATAAAGNS
jgi:anti-anti-sigma regulatory factor